MQKHILPKLIILCLAFVLVFSGCGKKPLQPSKKPIVGYDPTPPTSISQQLAEQTQIRKFSDYEELKAFLENNVQAAPSYGYASKSMDFGLAEANQIATPAGDMMAKSGASEGLGAGSDDYSQTNVQVEGVDEADIIKTDGKYVYAVVNKDVFIVDAYPTGSSKVVSKIALKSRPENIYINGDSLVVYGHDDYIFKTDLAKILPRRSQYNFFKVFDVSNPKIPKQVRDLDFEGRITNSRMIGDYVYLISSTPARYDDVVPLPRIIEDGEILPTDTTASRCNCPDVYYFDIPYQTYNFTSVIAVNVANNRQGVSNEVYLMAYNQNMYVSKANLYITYTRHISEYQLQMEVIKELVYPRLKSRDQEKISKIETVENYILSPAEKQRKIMEIIERFVESLPQEEQEKLEEESEEALKQKYEDIAAELEKTIIHKVNIDGSDIEYQTQGEVTGRVLNQFSMDEHDTYFRIATTKSRTWSRFDQDSQESYNNLYILDKNLNLVGAVEGLAEGERIYSVRFMQGRAYMVTFKQVDPLFVIDLQNPKNPKVLGELKIPGFSNYLHPYDENLLIGFGKDTGETEWGGVRTKGLKLSLFDVSQMGDPKEVDTYVLGDMGSDSIALHDHKAFLFSKDKHLLSVPVTLRESIDGRRWGKFTFGGAVVFNVDETGFKLMGKIDHSDGGKRGDQEYWRGYNYYDNTVKRSLYIDDVLYTFSSRYLKMNSLDDLDLVKNLRLKKERLGDDDDYEIIN